MCEYLKDTGLDLERPWLKSLKMEFGLGSATFGIRGINFFPFARIQNNGSAYKFYLDLTMYHVSRRSRIWMPPS